ncbi:MAG: DNA translocase FtsK 4TM domain-containing protein, partial [Thalassolituus sp.]
LVPLFGFIGTVLIYLVGLALGLVLFLEFSWLQFFERVGSVAFSVFARLTQRSGGRPSAPEPEHRTHRIESEVPQADSAVPSNEKAGLFTRLRSGLSGVRGKKTQKAKSESDLALTSDVVAGKSRTEPVLDSIDDSVADELDGFDGFFSSADGYSSGADGYSSGADGSSDFPPWNDDADEADVPAYERRPLRSRESANVSQKQAPESKPVAIHDPVLEAIP